MSAYVELFMDQGANFNLNLYAIDDSTNSKADLLGYDVVSRNKRSYATNTYASFTSTIINGTEGIINISIDAHSTAAMKSDRYIFDVKMTDPTRRVTRLLEETATVTPEVTK